MRANERSSMPHASEAVSAVSLPNTVIPIFRHPIGLPDAVMTPMSHAPLSARPAGFAAALAFGAGFLAAGVVAAPGAGCTCARTEVVKHDKTIATANDRIMKTRVR